MELPLPLQSYQTRSKPLSSQRLLNMFIEPPQDNNVKSTLLFGAPGLKLLGEVPSTDLPALGVIYLRGYLVYADSDAIRVIRSDFQTGFAVKVVTWEELNMVNPSSHVQMQSNGDDILILNSEAGKLVVATGTIDTDWDIHEPDGTGYDNATQWYTSITQIAGVFVATANVTDTTVTPNTTAAYVKWGEVLDPDNWQYATALDTSLEALTGAASNMRELWVFSPNFIEILAPTGNAGNFFFGHLQGAYINRGCKYKNSIATDESSFLFVASDDAIYVSRGYNLSQISTPAIVDMMKEWGTPEDIIGHVYSQGGHRFYVLKFKGLKKTLVYDLTTQSWTERESGFGDEWIGENFVRDPNGNLYVTHYATPQVMKLDLDEYTDLGAPIFREFVFPTVYGDNKHRMFFYTLTIEMDVGLGPGDEVYLSWSDDGGYVWHKRRKANLGARGEYCRKIQFRRLGSGTYRTFKVNMGARGRVNVLRSYIEAEEGDA